MVAKFVSVEDFAIRSGLGDIDSLAEEVQTKAQYCIEAATTYLASTVRTAFDVATLTDIFYVDSMERPWVGEFPRFYLSQGFVTSTIAQIELHVHWEMDDISNVNYHVDTKYLKLEQTKGTILVTGTDIGNITKTFSPQTLDRQFVQIIYDAGFTAVADAFGTIYEGHPEWLREAAIILAKSIFDNGTPCDDKGTDASGSCVSIAHLMDGHIRFLPSALKPMD